MGLSPDEKWMAVREGTLIPVRNFDYTNNKSEYLEFLQLLQTGGSVGVGRYGGPDFEALASLWEQRVVQEEQRLVLAAATVATPIARGRRQKKSSASTSPVLATPNIFRKTVKQIERFYESVHRFMAKDDAFDLNGVDLTNLADKLRSGGAPAQTGKPTQEPTARDAPAGFGTMAFVLPLSMATASVPRGSADAASADTAPASFASPTLVPPPPGVVYFPAHAPNTHIMCDEDVKILSDLTLAKARRPQTCIVCGHYKLIGHYAQLHSPNSTTCPFANEPAKCIPQGEVGLQGFCYHNKKGSGCEHCGKYRVAVEKRFGRRTRKARRPPVVPVAVPAPIAVAAGPIAIGVHAVLEMVAAAPVPLVAPVILATGTSAAGHAHASSNGAGRRASTRSMSKGTNNCL